MNLYVTTDQVGAQTGGGLVTHHELEALKSLGETKVLSRKELLHASLATPTEPWGWDEVAMDLCHTGARAPRLCHLYSGTFGKTVRLLKDDGCRVTYCVAAHDREMSRREHEALGISFGYPHLVEEELWQRYIEGYKHADVIICPSRVAARTVRRYGGAFDRKCIAVIPHGVDLPEAFSPLPSRFVVGYLGAIGPDKGLRYLLSAWKKLGYRDAQLVIAGRESSSPFMYELLKRFGGGNIHLAGWQHNVSEFYNKISLLVQPSATEGFGLEVLEAMAHGRPVICSDGAGAADVVPLYKLQQFKVKACDENQLADAIDFLKKHAELAAIGENNRKEASKYTWEKVRRMYVGEWEELLM